MIDRKYPNTRFRRLRRNSKLINLVSENTLNCDDLIQPIFIKEKFNGSESIETMPEIKRFSIDSSLKEIEDIIKSGVNTVAIFPVIDPDKKDDQGSEAIKSDNFISSTIRKIKE